MNDIQPVVVLATIVGGAMPLVFAALGETVSEKSGLINLSVDGSILLAAMVAFAVAQGTESLWMGFLCAALVGGVVASVVAFSSIVLGLSQLAVGFVLTLMCRDLAYFLGNPYARSFGPQVPAAPIPFLCDIPVAGPMIFNHNVLVYLSYFVIAGSWYYFYHTGWGLELRAVGEHPQAAYARGIAVKHQQFVYAVVGGMLVGVAGAAFSLCTKPGWGRPQGAEGMGWIALAIVIFGGWHPLKVAFGAYLFACLQVLGITLQNLWPGVPAQVFQTAPFPLMIFVLLLMHITQKETVVRWGEAHPRALPLLRFFKAGAPRALGQSLKQKLGA